MSELKWPLVVALVFAAPVFYVTYTIMEAITPDDIRLFLGGVVVLVIVVVVFLLLIAYSAVQSRLRRQELAQDDFDELRKMQMLLNMGGKATYNVKYPEMPQLPASVGYHMPSRWVEGEWVDTTADIEDVAIE